MIVDCYFGKIGVGLRDLEKDGDVVLVASRINILCDMLTSKRTSEDGWDKVLREGAECRLCNLGIET